MNLHLFRWLCVLYFFVLVSSGRAFGKDSLSAEFLPVDSVMAYAKQYAVTYDKEISEYNAKLYLKGNLHVRKKNFLFRFIPKMFRLQKGVDDYIIESYSQLHYTAPDIYDQKIESVYGTVYNNKFNTVLLEYFYVNVYHTFLLYDRLLSPLAANGDKYYRYQMDSVMCDSIGYKYKIRFMPKVKSDQLVGGYMIISDKNWTVRELRFSGWSGVLSLENLITMGKEGSVSELLPVDYKFNVVFKLAWNVVDAVYSAHLDYGVIKHSHSTPKRRRDTKYDLSNSFTLRCDTNKSTTDSLFISQIRPISLSQDEQTIYKRYLEVKKNTTPSLDSTKVKQKNFLNEFNKYLLQDLDYESSRVGRISCSPLINPMLLSYSKGNGFSWRQKFKYNRWFTKGKSLQITPWIGYNFTRKEFYWAVDAGFDYLPSKQAVLQLSVGNGNRIYSSDVLEDLKSMPDSLIDFKKLHLNLFYDLYCSVSHSIELVNGLRLLTAVTMHKRTAIESPQFSLTNPQLVLPPEIVKKLKGTYVSFAPRIRIEWTPGTYYYMNRGRKMNLYSRYPTMSVDYERGLKGVFGSSGTYERIEADIQHRIPIGLMNTIFYRVGAGGFTNQNQVYFVDFVNFSSHNLPVGWNDDMGGVFQLLDSRWYNSSREYLRAHVTYESPFLFFRHFIKHTRYIEKERLYFNVLFMNHIRPYMELGYGIGTSIFDFGVFIGSKNWKYSQIGCKFTFELFNR